MRPPQVPRRTATVRPENPGRRPAAGDRTSSRADGAARRDAAPRPAATGRPGPAEPLPVVPHPARPRPAAPAAPVPSQRPPAEVHPSTALSRLASAPRPTVLATAERFAERTRLRRRLTRQRLAWSAAGAAAVGALGWVAFFSPVLALDVEQVEVVGEGTVVDPATVLDVVGAYDGTPLPRLDTVELRRGVLDVPGVRAAEVARDWPHGLRITLVSREPVAAVPAPAEGPGGGGSDAATAGYLLLDVEGVQVGRSAEPPAGLPVVAVPADDEDARAMTAVLAVLESLPPELADQVTGAGAGSEDTVSLTLADGARVEWGSAEQSALKARVVLTLRAAPASAGASVFDVSAPTMPITHS